MSSLTIRVYYWCIVCLFQYFLVRHFTSMEFPRARGGPKSHINESDSSEAESNLQSPSMSRAVDYFSRFLWRRFILFASLILLFPVWRQRQEKGWVNCSCQAAAQKWKNHFLHHHCGRSRRVSFRCWSDIFYSDVRCSFDSSIAVISNDAREKESFRRGMF